MARSTPESAPPAGVELPTSLLSPRLLIRAPRAEDAPQLFEAVRESLPELQPWMPWATLDYSLKGCRENLSEAAKRFAEGSDLRYHFFAREDGRLLGSSGLHRIDWRVPRFEIGYWIRTSRTGQGLVSETVRALSRLAFEELHARRVEIRCDHLNVASGLVAERCGFQLEGLLRNWKRGSDGSLRDERIYALVDPALLR